MILSNGCGGRVRRNNWCVLGLLLGCLARGLVSRGRDITMEWVLAIRAAGATTLSNGYDSRIRRDNWCVLGLLLGTLTKYCVTEPLFSKFVLHYECAKRRRIQTSSNEEPEFSTPPIADPKISLMPVMSW
ncbi:hypothetical protein EDB87DRAFT_1611176 [Lactarius vividus]|nr:hypothetical protein EDB87DRAFT_1611176 [Lactarius vividus]